MSAMPATLLIVDKDVHVRKLLEVLLRGQGYQTLTAWSGKEALAMVKQHAPDLILLQVRDCPGRHARRAGGQFGADEQDLPLQDFDPRRVRGPAQARPEQAEGGVELVQAAQRADGRGGLVQAFAAGQGCDAGIVHAGRLNRNPRRRKGGDGGLEDGIRAAAVLRSRRT